MNADSEKLLKQLKAHIKALDDASNADELEELESELTDLNDSVQELIDGYSDE